MADPAPPEQRQKPENFWVQAARYSQIAFILPASSAVGWLIGVGLDRWLHTTWLYLAGILLGIIAGFVELIRTALRDAQ